MSEASHVGKMKRTSARWPGGETPQRCRTHELVDAAFERP